MAKLETAPDLGSGSRKGLEVRVLSPPPLIRSDTMQSMSETRRIAHQLCERYPELDFQTVIEKIKDMTVNQFRSWKSELQTRKLNDAN